MDIRKLVYLLFFLQVSVIILLEKNGYFYKWKNESFLLNNFSNGETLELLTKVRTFPATTGTAQKFTVRGVAIGNRRINDDIIVNTKYISDIKRNALIRLRGRIIVPGESAGFDYNKYLLRKKISCIFIPENPPEIIKKGKNSFFYSLINKIQNFIRQKIDDNLDSPENEMLKGLLLGEKALLPAEIRRQFMDSGVAHLLAVSGLHVGIILFFLLFLFRLLNLSDRISSLIIIPVLFIYTAVVGFSPSVTRAFIMSAFGLSAIIIGRENEVRHSIVLSAIFLIFINPLFIFDVGFQLSYLATFGIIYFSKKVNKILPLPAGNTREVIAVSFSAQIATLPAVAVHFNKLNLDGILTNIFAVPLVGIIIPVAFSGLFFSFFPYLSYLLFSSDWILLKLLNLVTKIFSGIPLASVPVITPDFVSVFYYYLLLAFIFLTVKKNFDKVVAFEILFLIGFIININYLNKKSYPAELVIKGNPENSSIQDSDSLIRLLRRGQFYLNELKIETPDYNCLSQAETILRNLKVKTLVLPENISPYPDEKYNRSFFVDLGKKYNIKIY